VKVEHRRRLSEICREERKGGGDSATISKLKKRKKREIVCMRKKKTHNFASSKRDREGRRGGEDLTVFGVGAPGGVQFESSCIESQQD